jgi:heme oxygenase (biliverdin-IX-beta and delta-forming)
MARADESPGRRVRDLVRQIPRAGLATLLAGDAAPWPYVSLVLVALDHDASPLLLLSDLADHTKNLRRDPRAALLFDGTGGWRDPLAGPRATLLGRIRPCDDARPEARFLARHPDAAVYAGFADFHLYRMAVERAHLVAGFGEIHWLDAAAVLFDTADCTALAAAEPEIVAHMNADHPDAVQAIATKLSPASPGTWTMTGIDPEGADFRAGERVARVAFEAPVHAAEAARRELVRLTRAAGAAGAAEL